MPDPTTTSATAAEPATTTPVPGELGPARPVRVAVDRATAAERVAADEQALQGIPVPAVLLDGHARIVAWNTAWESEHALDRPAMVDPGGNYLGHWERALERFPRARPVVDALHRVLAGVVEVETVEMVLPSPVGRRSFSVRMSGLGRHGAGVLLAFTPMDEIAAAETELRVARAETPLRTGGHTRVVAVIDVVDRVVHLADWTRELLVVAAGPMTFDAAVELVHPVDRSLLEDAVRAAIADRSRSEIELRVGDGEGRFHHLDLRVIDLRHDPEVRGLVVVGGDVSQRHRDEVAERLSRYLNLAPRTQIMSNSLLTTRGQRKGVSGLSSLVMLDLVRRVCRH